MIVIVDKIGYVIPSSVRQSILRTLGGKQAREHGVTLERVRRLVRERIRGKLRYQQDKPFPVGGNGPESSAYWTIEKRVASVMTERWVREWVKSGAVEVVTRGRYRRS